MRVKAAYLWEKVRYQVWSGGDQRGQILIIVGLIIIALLAAVGLAIDLGLMYVEKVRLGRAVDAAALAGAQELPDEFAAYDRMREYFGLNGYEEGEEGFQFSWAFPKEAGCDIPDPDICDIHYHLVVSATQTVDLTFMRVLGFQNVQVPSHATGENANRLDIALVLDVSGSMDDDTCNTGGLSHGCTYWWDSYDDIVYEDFQSYVTGDGTSAGRLCSASSPWACEYADQVGTTSSSRCYSGNCSQTEGNGTDGRFYRYFDASSYDQIEVVLRERTYSCGSDDRNRAWYSRDGGGWNSFMSQNCEDSWDLRMYLLQGLTSSFGVRFGVSSMESGDYGYFDNIRARGMVNGPTPSGPLGNCPGYGHSDCIGMNYLKQPLYDTLAAADWFISECKLPTGGDPEDWPDCLDEDLDQVGLAYYSDDGIQSNYYPSSNDSGTAAELSSDYSVITSTLYTDFDAGGWTNIGDGIYRGSEILSTNEAQGHNGRTSAVHIIILLSDGNPNRPCTTDCGTPNPEALAHIDDAVAWARANSIIIFTISLGGQADPVMMEENIADPTGGVHHHADTTDDLEDIFFEIAQHLFLRLVG